MSSRALIPFVLLVACGSTAPQRPSDPREAARLALEEGRVTEVPALLAPVVAAGQASPGDHVVLAESWLRRGDGQKAYDAALDALEGDESLGAAHRVAGEAAYLLGRHEIALEQLEAVEDPDAAALVLVSRLRLETGAPKAAEEAARRALVHDGGADAQVALGLALAKLGDVDGALGAFESAIAAAPDDPGPRYHAGNLLVAKGDLRGAEAAYRAALERDSMMVDAMRNLGSVLVMQDKADEAARVLSQALRFAPDSPELLNNLGVALTRAGNDEDAMLAFTKAVANAPEQASVRANAANAFARMGRFDDALRLLSDASPETAGELRTTVGRIVVARELTAARCAGVSDSAATRARVTSGLMAAGIQGTEARAAVEAVLADPELLLAVERATAACGQ